MAKSSIKSFWHRIKQYPIIGVPYQKLIGNRKTKRVFEEKSKQVKIYGKEAIGLIENALPQLGVMYFVDFGSLLGVVRDNDFIKWDPDIDYALIIDRDFDWTLLQRVLNTLGFSLIKEWRLEDTITEQTYKMKSLTVDFFGHYYSDNEMIAYVYSRVSGRKYRGDEFGVYKVSTPLVVETKKDYIGNVSVTIPVNSEQYLASLYFDDWKTPNPNWEAFSGPAYNFMADLIGIPTEYDFSN